MAVSLVSPFPREAIAVYHRLPRRAAISQGRPAAKWCMTQKALLCPTPKESAISCTGTVLLAGELASIGCGEISILQCERLQLYNFVIKTAAILGGPAPRPADEAGHCETNSRPWWIVAMTPHGVGESNPRECQRKGWLNGVVVRLRQGHESI
jgi:hypothetical protein